MKTVFTNDMLAHVWAQQSQDEGRTSNHNFSFRGPALYSYRTMIACFVTGTRKRPACLISSRSYSMTTASKHLPQVRRAVHGVPVFYVPVVSRGNYHGSELTTKNKTEHKSNLAYLVAEYKDAALRFKRAKSIYWIASEEQLAERLSGYAQTAVNYADMFGLSRPKLNPDGDASTIWAYRVDRDARTSTPEHQRKLERSRVRREERKAEEEERKRKANYADAQSRFVRYMQDDNASYCPRFDFPSDSIEYGYLQSAEHARNMDVGRAWKAHFDEWQSGLRARPEPRNEHAVLSVEEDKIWTDAVMADALAKNAAKIAAWREGSTAYMGGLYDVPTMLRVKDDQIQTSRGAEFPLSHALRAIPLVLRCVARAEGWQRNDHTIALGHFQLDSIDANGNVKAGCHEVSFTEIQALIATLQSLGHAIDSYAALAKEGE